VIRKQYKSTGGRLAFVCPAGLAFLLLLLAGPPSGASAERFSCLADSDTCPLVMIEGDPWHELPGSVPSPFRGYADPSVRRDPVTGRLWLTYSYLSTHLDPGPAAGVSIHLASSDDGGDTWQFRRTLERSRPIVDAEPPFTLGVSVHEVSTLTPTSSGRRRWFGMHFRYFSPLGGEGRHPTSFQLRLRRAARPTGLGRGPEQRLAGWLVGEEWRTDVDLSALAPELGECAAWTEPSLFHQDSTLYLVAQCIVLDRTSLARRPRQEFVGVFASSGNGPRRGIEWRWLGKLTTWEDARALGAPVLTQPEVTMARDGLLRLLVTPKVLQPDERHRGCRALRLESLDPPRLTRTAAGRPVVTADIRSPDSTGLGPGLCSYDSESSTGILFVRTDIDLEPLDAVFSLHATGIHP